MLHFLFFTHIVMYSSGSSVRLRLSSRALENKMSANERVTTPEIIDIRASDTTACVVGRANTGFVQRLERNAVVNMR